jgi:transcriptional regulator with XRE-family HTH domain
VRRAIARLEAGGHEPSLATLGQLAQGLGIEFHIDITPDTLELRETAEPRYGPRTRSNKKPSPAGKGLEPRKLVAERI